jgi:hypothetical protein
MYKKSLFFGAAVALSLLVLFAFAGCSNPSSSGDTQYVSQNASEYIFPDDTVWVDNRAALEGLLNETGAPTNQVSNIAYDGPAAALADLVIPMGKIVYLDDDYRSEDIGGNITVREGAKLVLVGNFIAGDPGNPGDNLLLTRGSGSIEVFRSLRVTNDTRDVADYTQENVIETGRNTVIGTHVTILPGATLFLDVTDIIPPLNPYATNSPRPRPGLLRDRAIW